MAAFMVPRVFGLRWNLRVLPTVFPAINRLVNVGDFRYNINCQSRRTLLSDAYHADDTWINRERIVVDMDEMKINLDRSFFDLKEPVMSVELHKYIDNVYDKEELDVAEGYLNSYRHSPMAHHLRQSTVHSFLRLCIELGHPQQALKVLQNKRDFGLFPEPFTYNVLLDSFLRADNIKGAFDVAVVMMREETLENCPLSQRLVLYTCHRYLNQGEIPQEDEWDFGMTLADATRNVEGTMAISYHALGYAMVGKLDRASKFLESVVAKDGVKIAQEAIEKIEAALDKQEDLPAESKELLKATVSKLREQDCVASESLENLMEAEISRLPELEAGDIGSYTALLEQWHGEHMEALDRQRLAHLEQERREKEDKLDQLQREAGGLKYWAQEIEKAQTKKAAAAAVGERVEHR